MPPRLGLSTEGGSDPCMKCGDKKGTRYYRKCYGGMKHETPAPVPPPPPQCNTYDEPCEHDSDCAPGASTHAPSVASLEGPDTTSDATETSKKNHSNSFRTTSSLKTAQLGTT